MRFSLPLCFEILLLLSCQNKNIGDVMSNTKDSSFIAAVDISSYPELMEYNPTFYNASHSAASLPDILRENGVNTIRIRLWVDPANTHSGLSEVSSFAKDMQVAGFKIWLTIHYSDTWADPGHQEKPLAWQNLDFYALTDTVFAYTKRVVSLIRPAYVQIGNEINDGLLFPSGRLSLNPENCIELLTSGVSGAREALPEATIILHYAGLEGADWFYSQVNKINYDMIGLSYYPIWHGKDLDATETVIKNLSTTYQKDIVIAETAYPFTLQWNDNTNNIVGHSSQLILPDFMASPSGQEKFIIRLKNFRVNNVRFKGINYWGAELISWKGQASTTGSSWENQALFDFSNVALPALSKLAYP
jgi:arabinogalactan endo-1,4-beta-galactosidase